MTAAEMTYAEALAFVEAVARAYGRGVKDDPESPSSVGAVSPGGKGGKVLICAAHPDDEGLTGALPLRLARESGCEVVVVAVTLGSDPARKEARLAELADATALLGWEWLLAEEPLALDDVTIAARDRDKERWQRQVEGLASLFDGRRPDLVLLPHGQDGHPTHVGVHHLAAAALCRHTAQSAREVLVAETEYWRQLPDPNLLVGVGSEDVARLVAAVSRHRGEVSRHPYHARLPFRMVDTVRRGSELLAGFGAAAAPPFCFGELYRLSTVARGQWHRAAAGTSLVCPPLQSLSLAALQLSAVS